jgi:glycosyltransferase involved in cell wall biosynthesis
MIRALLAVGCKVDLILLNQSENSTASKDIKARTLAAYGDIDLNVDVRRHPKFQRERLIKRGGITAAAERVKNKLLFGAKVFTGEYARINSSDSLPGNFESLILKKLTSKYDTVWFNYARLIPEKMPSAPRVVVDLHDIQTYRVRNDVLPKLAKWERRRYERIFAKTERAAMRKADICLSISSVETAEIRRDFFPGGNIVTVNATDDERFSLNKSKQSYDFLFVGSNSDPNVDGLIWFLENSWPIIHEQRPSSLLIQGNITRNPKIKRAVDRAVGKANITLQGFVKDLNEVYAGSGVVLCPIRYGTGMKIKVVEAMSYGMPIVATSAALEGIDLELGLMPIDDPFQFAAQSVKLAGIPVEAHKQSLISKATFSAGHSRDYLLSKVGAIIFGIN